MRGGGNRHCPLTARDVNRRTNFAPNLSSLSRARLEGWPHSHPGAGGQCQGKRKKKGEDCCQSVLKARPVCVGAADHGPGVDARLVCLFHRRHTWMKAEDARTLGALRRRVVGGAFLSISRGQPRRTGNLKAGAPGTYIRAGGTSVMEIARGLFFFPNVRFGVAAELRPARICPEVAVRGRGGARNICAPSGAFVRAGRWLESDLGSGPAGRAKALRRNFGRLRGQGASR